MNLLKKLTAGQYPIYSLVVFRIAFGLIMMWEVWRFFKYDWITRYYIDPPFNFHYGWFDWVTPWPGAGMYIHFALLALLAAMICVGLLYRLSTILFFLGFSYVFLLEQARYLNHFYLVVLLSFLIIFLPCNRWLSLDALIWPKIKGSQVAAWTVNLLRLQLGIVYFFGGVAKINSDWLAGRPMDSWLASRTDFPIIGPLMTERWMVMLMSYSGMLLDLLIAPFLLWRKSRLIAFAAISLFHGMNDRLFSIGIFPWFMMIATTIFLPSDWPTKLLKEIRSTDLKLVTYLIGGLIGVFVAVFFHKGDDLMPVVAGFLAGMLLVYLWNTRGQEEETSLQLPSELPKRVVILIAIWTFIQVIVPLRHFFIPGNVNWTEEGHRFSWHMKLRDKSGQCFFELEDPEIGKISVDPKDYLTSWQYRKMVTRPYMMLQFADHLEGMLYELRGKRYDIRINSSASLNGRKPLPLIDPSATINGKRYNDWRRNEWILLKYEE